ncbi:5'-3' exonuclease, N-terminal resolvase-like domain [Cryobacterium luteum]|nr:5'-3' exonuclease, N-terminal resolvase-like domain [Cryobacterium luteum]
MLLDTAALYFRAFYGVPDTVRGPDGQPVNAVRGLLDMIARLATEFEPTEIVACWDNDWRPQWRVDLIPTYKTHRVAAAPTPTTADADPALEVVPDLLSPQVPIIREVLGALGIPIVGAARHEADDVIGTLASHAATPVDIVTGDRDLFQLVDDSRHVRVIYTGRAACPGWRCSRMPPSRSGPASPLGNMPTSPRCAATPRTLNRVPVARPPVTGPG